jgi:phage terminase large subunit GpA-like protein
MSEELVAFQIEGALARVRKGYAPPPDLTVSEFADKEIVVTSGPLAGTHWRTDFAPYQRGIMDVFHEPGVEVAVVMGSSQWGKTASAVNIVAYHIAHDPCPILVVEPTVDPMAKDFAKNRLDTVINASPALRGRVGKKRAKDASNTTSRRHTAAARSPSAAPTPRPRWRLALSASSSATRSTAGRRNSKAKARRWQSR